MKEKKTRESEEQKGKFILFVILFIEMNTVALGNF
jgi:hypothetical protein